MIQHLKRYVFDIPRLVLGNNVQQMIVGAAGVESITLEPGVLTVRQGGQTWCVTGPVGSGEVDESKRELMSHPTSAELGAAYAQAERRAAIAAKGKRP